MLFLVLLLLQIAGYFVMPTWLIITLGVLTLIGTYFRFANDQKLKSDINEIKNKLGGI